MSGKAILPTASGVATGELIDIAVGSLLLRSEAAPSRGASLPIRFTVDGHPGEFVVRGRVVRTQQQVLAVVFLEEPEELQKLMKSLEAAQQSAP